MHHVNKTFRKRAEREKATRLSGSRYLLSSPSHSYAEGLANPSSGDIKGDAITPFNHSAGSVCGKMNTKKCCLYNGGDVLVASLLLFIAVNASCSVPHDETEASSIVVVS